MTAVVKVRLLGGFDASSGERSLPPGAWRLRKARSLVKLLALEPTRALHRDHVIDALWPDADAAAGRNNLNQVVHAARKALSMLGLDATDAIAVDGDLLVLGRGMSVMTDLEELRTAVAAAEASGRRDEVVRLLADQSDELLAEDAYEDWARAPVTAFREWRMKLVLDTALAELAAGDAESAVVLLAPVVGAEPLHEPASRALMRALAAAGRRSEALLVYERLRDVLREELATEPEQETRQVFRELLTTPPTARPGVIPAPRLAGALPARLTPLIGRDRELAETHAILGRTRLLTLTGMGGAGKTSLAVELARRSLADYAGGVHLVELGALTDGDEVPARIARILDVEVPAGAAPLDVLGAQLSRRQLLLVLDNCEHLLDSCARVAGHLLRACPELSVLATSREALRIEGEVSWRTPSLDLPDPAAAGRPQELAGVASVALFLQRAAAAQPEFAVTEDNAAAIADVCYRLDGIPLALELAAACIPALSPQQIADRLADSLSLLRRGGRGVITRQQTLEATLAWSHDLLAPAEQVLFRRLAVFAGSFTLDAVESVCGGGLDPSAILIALSRLIDTSLVVAETRDDVTRYRLLETVRQYAAEHMRASGEYDVLQARHCAWYLRFAQDRDPQRSVTPLAVLPTSLDVEHDNLRAALTWALEKRPALALELAAALWRYWLARGLFTEGRLWLDRALQAATDPTRLRAQALIAAAVFDARRGRIDGLAELGYEAVLIHRQLGRDRGLAQALYADAVIAYMRGVWDEAWARAHEARELAEELGTPEVELAARHLHAMVFMGRGQLAEADAALQHIRTGLTAISAPTAPFLSAMLLGFMVERGADGGPRLYFEETLLLGRLVGSEQAYGYVCCNLSDIARMSGDTDAALRHLDGAAEMFASLADRDGVALALSRRGCLLRRRGEYDAGREALDESLRIRRLIGDRRAIQLTQSNLGLLTAAAGDVRGGRALIEDAFAASCDMQDGAARVGLTLTLGCVDADAGDLVPAARLLTAAATDSAHIPGNARASAWAYVVLADVLHRLGRVAESAQARRDARRLFAAIGAIGAGATRPPARKHAQSRR